MPPRISLRTNVPTGVSPDLSSSLMPNTSVPDRGRPLLLHASFYKPSHERCAPAALIRCYIRMVLLGSKWIWFHYTLTNGPSNNFKLAEHVPSHQPWHNLSLIKNRGECVASEHTQHIKEVVFWNERRVCLGSLKCKNKMCVRYLS